MKAATEVHVGLDARGRSIATVIRCEAPLLFRVAAEPGDALQLSMVGGAAGPLGGDDLQLQLYVGEGASVIVRSVGATMVQPGTTDAQSNTDIHVTVAAGARLDWWPEPTVSVIGSRHRAVTTIELAADASLRWVDEVSLGRFDEASGRLSLRQRLEVSGRVVVDHETEFGSTALTGPGGHGHGRCILSALIVGDDAPTTAESIVGSGLVRGVFPVEPRVALVTCVAAKRYDQNFGLTV